MTLLEVKCRDNGEGNDWPHGPFGHIYMDFFEDHEDLNVLEDELDKKRLPIPRTPRRLRGPWRTHEGLDEWLDQNTLAYQRGGIFEWKDREAIIVRLYESDGSEDGEWGRRNDVLGFEKIHKAHTLGQILTVPCYGFSSSHPRRRGTRVCLELKLTTRHHVFPSQMISEIEVPSGTNHPVVVGQLKPAQAYAIQVEGSYVFAKDGRQQDAVYRQEKSGNWSKVRAEAEKGLRIQGRCPWNSDVAPPFAPNHTYRFVAITNLSGEIHFAIADNQHSDNRGSLKLGIFGPL